MKYFQTGVFIFIGFTIFMFGCEQTIDGNLEYKERLVIRSVLEANDTVTVTITKTMPPLDPYPGQAAIITNATGFISCEGKTYPLRHRGNGIYTTDSLIAQVGKTYTFEANWNNKKVFAQTTVPIPITPDTILLENKYLTQQGNSFIYYVADVHVVISTPNIQAVQCGIYRIDYNYEWASDGRSRGVFIDSTIFSRQFVYPPKVFSYRDTDESGKIHVLIKGANVDQSYHPTRDGVTLVVLNTFDKPYYDYFKAASLQPGDRQDILGNTAIIQWNVIGDGIGMFVGKSTSFKKINLM